MRTRLYHRFSRPLTALAILPILTSCSGHSAEDTRNAEAALQTVRSQGVRTYGMPPPRNLPAFAPLPPDNFVDSTSEGDRGRNSGAIEFSTALKPGAVIAFYREAALAAGLSSASEHKEGDVDVLDASGAGRSLKIQAKPLAGVGATVTATYE